MGALQAHWANDQLRGHLMSAIKDFTIFQGKTFSQVLRWESPLLSWREITGITNTAPVRITAPAHGVPDGWRIDIASVKGMSAINGARGTAHVVDVDTIEINALNASEFRAYAGGGYVSYRQPVDLSGMTARMSIKSKVGGLELLRLDSSNARILIDPVGKTISLSISATDTEGLGWKKGVYDLEMVSPDGTVTGLLSGKVVVAREVTTS